MKRKWSRNKEEIKRKQSGEKKKKWSEVKRKWSGNGEEIKRKQKGVEVVVKRT